MTDRSMHSDDEFARLLDAYQQAIESGQTAHFWDEHPCDFSVRTRVMELESLVGGLDRYFQDGRQPSTTAYHLPVDLSVLHRFTIEAEIGRGSYGIVYRANDPMLKRQVAIKVPRLETLSDPVLRERFRQEAKLAAGIDHPHVLPVFEVGTVGKGDYIVTAFCPGSNLAQWLAETTNILTYTQIAELIEHLAEGLSACHARHILHRDLKPANVMLFPDACGSLPFWPKLTDFGLAKAIDSDLAETAGGIFLGTPMYMSPEQACGEKAKIGPETDVYALGAILYELLTRRPPFQADSIAAMLDQVRSHEPILPTKMDASIPKRLESICLKCLNKAPEDRYLTAKALQADLRRYIDGHDLLNASRPGLVSFAKGIPSSWKSLAIVSMMGIVLAIGFYPFEQWRSSVPARQELEEGLLFGPSENRVFKADVPFFDNSPITIETWIRPDQPSGMIFNYAGVLMLFSGDESEGEGPSIRAMLSEDELVYSHALETIDRDGWHHLAAIYDGERFQIYIDGQSVKCSLTSDDSKGLQRLSDDPIFKLHQIWPDNTIMIGSNNTKSSERYRYPYSGRIRSVMISKSVRYHENFLPEQVLKANDSTLALYVFNSETGEVLSDRSGNDADAVACKIFDTSATDNQ